MKLNIVLAVWAIITALFGLGFFFVPEMTLAMYREVPSSGHIVMARLYGGTALGFALLAWLTRSITDQSARRKILTAILVFPLVHLVVFLKAILLDGQATPTMLLTVTLPAVFLCLFGYFYLTKRD
ncbi:MAG: hypothetical protein FJ009_02305 [Chloroflexi bacterium]|nr:hypothetical protein [Chloroflexota bacterium]